MIRHLLRFLSLTGLPSALLFLAGCGPSEPGKPTTGQAPAVKPSSNPEDVPITEADVKRPTDFADAVKRIEGYRNMIRDEIAAGRPHQAHRALDELEIVLNWLPEIAQESQIPKEKWETINVSAQEIRDLFGKVHANIDAGRAPDYKPHAEAIDAAVEKLSIAAEKK